VKEIRKERLNIASAKQAFLDKTSTVEMSIRLKGQELKQFIDSKVQELLNQLQSAKSEEEKEVDACLENVDVTLVAIESFLYYSQEVKDKGRPCDISRLANDLNARASELMKMKTSISPHHPPDVTFVACNFKDQTALFGSANNLLGQLRVGPEVKLAVVSNIDTPLQRRVRAKRSMGSEVKQSVVSNIDTPLQRRVRAKRSVGSEVKQSMVSNTGSAIPRQQSLKVTRSIGIENVKQQPKNADSCEKVDEVKTGGVSSNR
jgi:hypothetical protein